MGSPKNNLIDRAAVVIVSDTHENHVYGLGPPTFTKSDGDTIKANPIRRELWNIWNKFWDQALKIADGYPLVIVTLGDIIESDAKTRSPQDLVSRSPVDALRMVTETLEPLFNQAEKVLVVRGTEAHVGNGAWQEEMVAQDFDNVIADKDHNNASWWHFFGKFGGVSFDLAHHASLPGIRRNVAGGAGRLASDVMTEYVMQWERRPPDLVVRAHNHRFADSGHTYPTRALFTGCFQYKSTFSHRIGKSHEMPNLGGLVVLCENGEYRLSPIRVRPKKKRLWLPTT